jgi:hypothetical protein
MEESGSRHRRGISGREGVEKWSRRLRPESSPLIGRTVASSKLDSGSCQNASSKTIDPMKYLQSMGLSDPIENGINGLFMGILK